MFSKACEYAIKSCIYIAKESIAENIVNVKQVAAAVDAPEAFTAKILQQITRAGILESVRGKQGGFFFRKDHLKNIKIHNIITIIDGDTIFTNCGLGLKECSDSNPCHVHEEFKEIRNRITQMAHKFSLQDLAEKTGQGIFTLKR